MISFHVFRVMDKIKKFLARLTPKERNVINIILEQIKNGSIDGLDIKKLKEKRDIFRVRKGNTRVLFRVIEHDIFILAVERRSEKIYRKNRPTA